jgi:hypothetical protein
VTVTETVQPSAPDSVTLNESQFGVFQVGIVLIVLFLTAILFAQMRRP